MTILKISLTGIVAIRASHRVLSAEPLVSSYRTKRAPCELMTRGIQIIVKSKKKEFTSSHTILTMVLKCVPSVKSKSQRELDDGLSFKSDYRHDENDK